MANPECRAGIVLAAHDLRANPNRVLRQYDALGDVLFENELEAALLPEPVDLRLESRTQGRVFDLGQGERPARFGSCAELIDRHGATVGRTERTPAGP